MIITAGIYKGRKVFTPDDKTVRPTLSKMREGVFNTLFSMMDFEGKSFLDAFAGSGIMGLEALSRGFESILALEKNPKTAKVLKENYTSIKLPSDLIIGDSLKLLAKLDRKFDVIYLDPPYFSGVYEDCLNKISKYSLLKDGGIVILEHVEEICYSKSGFEMIKQKKYSGKTVTFLQVIRK
ncbi:MAG: 16S rRNA (guanine(966)-N(2))-methyltransferase RsmD [Candidatus Gastranaerophilales bacterium]|nr:16S rRNA (guanine(966)-N(2))-methyltransferase RsmD [Candidatus Gastranaerophilales bacterium]